MAARVAVTLSTFALLGSAVAVVLAVVLLIQGGNGELTPTKDEPGAHTKAMVEEAI